MKKLIFSAAALIFLLCGCGNKTDGETAEETVYRRLYADFIEKSAPFAPYTFTVSNGADKYLVTFAEGNNGISFSVEDNAFNAVTGVIIPPEGYSPVYSSAARSGGLCGVIENDIDSSVTVPDIIRVNFSDGENNICRFYTVNRDGLNEIEIYAAKKGGKGEKLPYIQGSALYHSEPLKFIGSIKVDESAGLSANISESVKILTYTFDPEKNTFTGHYERLSADNPLYFGYAYWGLANNTARYFTETNLKVSDYEHFEEAADENGENMFFFKVDDPRFSNKEELTEYLKQLFSERAAKALTENAPQKYRDINGSLYTLTGQSVHDNSLGMMTFTSCSETDKGDVIVYGSRQEKYDENGEFTGYTDGGTFRLEKHTEWKYDSEEDDYFRTERWVVAEYRYPYS